MLISHFPELQRARALSTFAGFFEKTTPTLARHELHPGQRIGRNDPVLKWRVIPAKCHGWSRNSYGAAEFISPESITGEVATEILSLEAE